MPDDKLLVGKGESSRLDCCSHSEDRDDQNKANGNFTHYSSEAANRWPVSVNDLQRNEDCRHQYIEEDDAVSSPSHCSLLSGDDLVAIFELVKDAPRWNRNVQVLI